MGLTLTLLGLDLYTGRSTSLGATEVALLSVDKFVGVPLLVTNVTQKFMIFL